VHSPMTFLAGAALALAMAALVLALWPVVGDAPWEAEPVIVQEGKWPDEPSQETICFRLLDSLAVAAPPVAGVFFKPVWDRVGCEDYFAGFAK